MVALTSSALAGLLAAQDHAKPLALRVSLSGRSAAHGALFGSEVQLREEVLALAAALGGERLWIEKVQVETTPALDAGQIHARADALADLQALLAQVGEDEDFLRSLTEDLRGLSGKAPAELGEAVPDLKAIRAGEIGPLIEAVIPGLLARLALAP